MKTTIYIEGGGNTKQLHSELRHGFKALFESAGFSTKLPKVVASGSRNEAYNDFNIAFGKKKNDELVLLLVDSEDSITTATKWGHVHSRDGWVKPSAANEDNIFFMVICMESWFLADKDGLQNFFGKGFETSKLPTNHILENIDKVTLYSGLKSATNGTSKGRYGKGQHSFKILTYLDASKVKNHGTYAEEFFKYLSKKL